MRGKKNKGIGLRMAAGALLTLFAFLAVTVSAAADSSSDDYLHTVGSQIYDASGNQVRLTGIAWFGFETQEQVYHGLWSVDMEDVLDTVADQGFNLLRIPLSVQLVNQWRNGNGGSPGSVNYTANPGLAGMTSLEILDASIAYCKQIGLKVMLDMHRVINTQMLNMWYTDDYPAGDLEACWQWLAQHYADDDTVIAMDLFNEPHGTPGDADMAKWDDSTDRNNWKYEAEKLANLVLDINPGLLVVIEGIEATPKDGHTYDETNGANYNYTWWGGNLRRVRDYPVNLGSRQDQVVYSPHDYGPSVFVQSWFYSGFTQASLTQDCWYPNWLYIANDNIAPILVGEWGGLMDGGDNEKWMEYLTDTLAQYELHHTFWCVNPNSGDTGGILLDDWVTVDTEKVNLIEPSLWKDEDGKYIGLDHMVDLGANGTHVGAADTSSTDNAYISPTTAVFDKDPAAQADITVTMTLNGNTLNAVRNGTGPLVQGTDYTVSGTTATILKSYLSGLATGTASLTFDFSTGADRVMTVTITETGDASATCDSPAPVTLPYSLDGAGEYCLVTSGDITYVNSWNMQTVEINGEDYTNTWSNTMPARINGNYYVYYVGSYNWSHLTIAGSGGSTQSVAVTDVSVSPTNVSLDVGDTVVLTATVLPADATDSSVAWRSSDESVATVGAGGVVKGVSAGTADITATTTDGGFEATSAVAVNETASDGDEDDGEDDSDDGGVNDDDLPDACDGACNAATPVYPTVLDDGGIGNVTMYSTVASSGGACNYGTTDVMYYAAINVNVEPGDGQGQWQGGRACGQCAEVTVLTSQGPQNVVVRIMDKCPDADCGIDLGGAAPGVIMLDGSGRYDGTWHFISCTGHEDQVSDGPPSLDVFNGSNPWWSRVHVRNGATAVDAIEWQDLYSTSSGSFPFATNPENTFEVPLNDVLQSGMSEVLITVYYVDGNTATVTLSPQELSTGSASYPLD
jgi:aryl-phospho-beta-D-glucosidase BglC (GH1 family)